MTELGEEGLSVTRRIFNWLDVRHGWASFELLREGSTAYRATVGDSTDVFRILTEGARLVLDAGACQEFSFDNEPGEIRWTLTPHGELLNIRVTMHSEWGRSVGENRWVAEDIDPRIFASDVLSSTVELFDRLGAEGFRRSWPSYPYPATEVEALREFLETF